jgi:hypothetical protein
MKCSSTADRKAIRQNATFLCAPCRPISASTIHRQSFVADFPGNPNAASSAPNNGHLSTANKRIPLEKPPHLHSNSHSSPGILHFTAKLWSSDITLGKMVSFLLAERARVPSALEQVARLNVVEKMNRDLDKPLDFWIQL